MKTNLKRLLIICIALFFSCDVDECNMDVYPVMDKVQLQNANIGEAYYETITAEILNEVNDDSFEYYYTVKGNLPSGISFEQNYRELKITGAPTVVGSFTFKVELLVAPRNNQNNTYSPICKDFTSRVFTLVIL